jgi:hypothetical protein
MCILWVCLSASEMAGKHLWEHLAFQYVLGSPPPAPDPRPRLRTFGTRLNDSGFALAFGPPSRIRPWIRPWIGTFWLPHMTSILLGHIHVCNDVAPDFLFIVGISYPKLPAMCTWSLVTPMGTTHVLPMFKSGRNSGRTGFRSGDVSSLISRLQWTAVVFKNKNVKGKATLLPRGGCGSEAMFLLSVSMSAQYMKDMFGNY